MGGQVAPDRRIATLATRHGGVISHRELRILGLTPREIGGRVAAGSLHPLHRGVYAVGHRAVGADGRRWAAVLALGEEAFVSHHSAADIWEIRPSSSSLVHVTVRGRGGRERRAGLRVHRPRVLPADEVTVLRGLPVTTPARTLLDLAGSGLHGRALEAALDAAELRCRLDFAELHRLLARYPRRPGTRPLKAQLSRYGGPVDTRSRLERLVNEVCDVNRLPRPSVNTVIEERVRNFHWPDRRLVVEADSYRWHRGGTCSGRSTPHSGRIEHRMGT